MWWGNSPLLAPPALERFQNRPHSHRGKKKGTTNSKHTLIAKSGAPPGLGGGGADASALCSVLKDGWCSTFQDWLKVSAGHVKSGQTRTLDTVGATHSG